MDIELQCSNEELLKKFKQLKTVDDVCNILEIDKKTLIYYIYRKRDSNYKVFSIKKRSGGKRSIASPISPLKIIQRKLSYILNLAYGKKPSVHGFCSDRSIVTNANIHSGKKSILNFDLENFFPSINFGRVRGLFISPPFSFPAEVATVLAQICILNNELPQGAPTSPIVSNLICSRLDGQLQKLAKNNEMLYTRYADDITLSSWRKDFPKNVIKKEQDTLIIGDHLRGVIESNGFIINNKKTRLSISSQRQIVTGLIVNKTPNVERNYIRELRAILHNWETYGIDIAKVEYYANRGESNRSPTKQQCDFRMTILGKINFVRMVRGYRNCVYRRLINKYNFIDRNNYPYLSINNDDVLKEYIWIVEVNDKPEGTGFLLEGYGFVTCNHVINLSNKIFIYRSDTPNKKYPVKLLSKNLTTDLAILDFEDETVKRTLPYFKKNTLPARIRDSVLVIGFPLIHTQKEPWFYEPKIVAFKETLIPRIILDKPFTSGMSGSPLLNAKNEVIGVLATGAENLKEASGVIDYTALPIKCLDGGI